jgi:RNA polymerase sigma-70 factor (ECF subfamily)
MGFPRLVRAPQSSGDALGERSDDELMRLARAGLRSAFEVLVRRHAAKVVGLCSRFVNDAELGRELAQDTWVRVWQSRDKYRCDGGFLPWLCTVARNHCKNELRRRKPVAVDSEVAEGTERSPEQLDALLVEERRRRVRGALEQLSTPMREALLLRFGEGLAYEEMTEVLGTGESTLRSRVHHGLRALKLELEADS